MSSTGRPVPGGSARDSPPAPPPRDARSKELDELVDAGSVLSDESAFVKTPPRRRARGDPATEAARRGDKASSKDAVPHKDTIVAEVTRSGEVSPWVLHPSHWFRRGWDLVQIFVLAYVTFAVPYREAFGWTAYGGWYILEFFVDVYFWIDLIMGFFTALWVPTEDDDVRYVTDLSEIRARYLRTWFAVDFLAALPFEYVRRALRGESRCSWDVTVMSPCRDETRSVSRATRRFLAFLGLFKLLKLARIYRAVRVFEAYAETLLKYHVFVTVSKMLLTLSLMSHFMACGYGSVYNFAREDHSGREGLHWELYIAALYWAVQTLTTVGYGNVVPQTVAERLIACGVMLLGGFIFSYIISKVSAVLDPESATNVTVREQLSVRRFVDEKRLPRNLVLRINAFHRNKAENAKPGRKDVVAALPVNLRLDVNYYAYGAVIAAAVSGDVLPSEAFIERVCLVMRSEIFTRDVWLAETNEYCERVCLVTEGQLCVSAREEDQLVDDGEAETRRYHLELTDAAKLGQPRLCGPGLLVNPGLALGCQRATLCIKAYDRRVEAATWTGEGFHEMVKEAHPELARNVFDAFVEQLKHSRRGMQRFGLKAVNRGDLWDEKKKRINTGWKAQVRAERKKEDEANAWRRDAAGGDAGDVPMDENPRLIPADSGGANRTPTPGEQMEAVQKQVRLMHADLSDVANRFRDTNAQVRATLGTNGAEIKRMEASMIAAMETHAYRMEKIETAIESLHRVVRQTAETQARLAATSASASNRGSPLYDGGGGGGGDWTGDADARARARDRRSGMGGGRRRAANEPRPIEDDLERFGVDALVYQEQKRRDEEDRVRRGEEEEATRREDDALHERALRYAAAEREETGGRRIERGPGGTTPARLRNAL